MEECREEGREREREKREGGREGGSETERERKEREEGSERERERNESRLMCDVLTPTCVYIVQQIIKKMDEDMSCVGAETKQLRVSH